MQRKDQCSSCSTDANILSVGQLNVSAGHLTDAIPVQALQPTIVAPTSIAALTIMRDTHREPQEIHDLDVFIIKRFHSRQIWDPVLGAFNIFTPFLAYTNSWRKRQITLLCPGGDVPFLNGYRVISIPHQNIDLEERGRYRIRVAKKGPYLVVSDSTRSNEPNLRPIAPDYPSNPEDIYEKLGIYPYSCVNPAFVNPIGRHPTSTIPALWWTPQFVALANKVGAVGEWPDLMTQLLDAQTVWPSNTSLTWSDHLELGDPGVDLFGPDVPGSPPGANSIWVHVHPGLKNPGHSGQTILFATPDHTKDWYSCNDFAYPIPEICQVIVYFNQHVEWNNINNIETGWNFQYVAIHEFGHALGLAHRPSSPCQGQFFNTYMLTGKERTSFLTHQKIRGIGEFPSSAPDADDISRMDKVYAPGVTHTPC